MYFSSFVIGLAGKVEVGEPPFKESLSPLLFRWLSAAERAGWVVGGGGPGPGGTMGCGGAGRRVVLVAARPRQRGQQVPKRFSWKHTCSLCSLSTRPSHPAKLVGPLVGDVALSVTC